MRENKKMLRQEVRSRLRELTKEDHEELSNRIAENLFSLEEWKKAKTIGITISIPPEVPTVRIIEQAWSEGKEVAVPKCDPEKKTMEFKKISSFNQLESVYSGLLEPVSETAKALKEELDVLIVPGLAFTREGYRLGFGGGYYDRYLSFYRGVTMALAYELQIMDELPIEVHDKAVGKLITPTKVFRTYAH
ncbi:5-formyltetrahydrofolate cyclo-ligase [Peribacillus sp. Bi96]|uniref:5-formyltetrahydrofolate cyclo-ligase n=1 Tax=unclassified Peribacillus TaxID=2675266 RepID=UPI001E035248|nr:5-formyltetrahydrofolate cyclo-ligase [Peribacillus sp. Bi96]CAH0316928.1 5-formyltetrahydrofolate cyclo-ligase [Peribacillus sp. Bi96]